MASAEETSYEEGGGAGRKFQKRSNRSDSKPYDRPPNWISKSVVNPTSRIITQSAHKLFSLVFPKALPTLTPTSEAKHESSDAIPDLSQCVPSGDQETEVNEVSRGNTNSDSAIDDLEQILKHRTFTRAEIDHLTELLQSKTSDISAEDEKRRLETTTSLPVEAPGKMENVPVEEEKRKTSFGTASVSLSRSSFHDEDVASPTELAKAYMESRSSKGTPSTLNFHDHSFRQDLSLQTSVQFTPNSHALVAVRSTDIPYASAPRGTESGYRTPAPQGRSALYSMTRTPYSRVHPSAMLKVNGSMTKEKAGLLTSSQMSWKNNLLLSGGKQASKRRSSVLDSDIGSIGPIRRTRRKTDMMFSSQSTGLSSSLRMPSSFRSDAATGPISTQNQFQPQGPKHITSVRGIMESGENSSAGRGSVCVPDQSRETAQKILQQLEKIAPSPKGKSRETTTLGTSPSRFMPDVLNGQGIKTTEGVHSSKLQNTRVRGILGGLGDKSAISARDLQSQKQAKFDEGGPSTNFTEDNLGPQAEGTVTRSTKDVASSLRTTAVMSSCVADKKRDSAEMANKNSMEHEQRNFNSIFHANPLVTDNGKHGRPVVENKKIVNGPVTDESCIPVSCISTPGRFTLKNSSDIKSFGNYPASEKNSLSSVPSEVAILHPSSLCSPSLNRISTSNKPKSVRFSFATEAVDKAAPVASGSSGLSGAHFESKEAKLETANNNRETCRGNNEHKVEDGGLKHTVSSSTKCTTTATSTTTSVLQFGQSISVSTAPSNSVSILSTAPGTTSMPFLQSSEMQFGSSASSQTSKLRDSLTTAGAKLFESGSGSITTAKSIMSSTSNETTGFKFGSASAAPNDTGAAASVFSFTSSSFSGFGAAKPDPSIGSASTMNVQMNTENIINEHTAPSFLQPSNSSPQPFSFDFRSPSSTGGSNMFQFSSQQDPTTSQSPSPNFSIGNGGGDKSNRRIVKVRRDKLRKR